jgi:hypothetical protein
MNIAKSILILVGIYLVLFQFNTDPIKYSLSLAWTYPGRATVVAVGVAILVICSSGVSRFMRCEADSVERFSKGSTMGISDAHAFLKARKLLHEPGISAKDDEAVLKDLVLRYQKVYDALPPSFISKLQNNNLRLNHKSQLFLLRIKPLKVGLLFIINYDTVDGSSIKITDHGTIPTVEEIKRIIGTSVPDRQIDLAIQAISDWSRGIGGIYNNKGYGGFFASPADMPKWSCWRLPIPLGSQYRSIIVDNLELGGLL